jgi:hypothetical protein
VLQEEEEEEEEKKKKKKNGLFIYHVYHVRNTVQRSVLLVFKLLYRLHNFCEHRQYEFSYIYLRCGALDKSQWHCLYRGDLWDSREY